MNPPPLIRRGQQKIFCFSSRTHFQTPLHLLLFFLVVSISRLLQTTSSSSSSPPLCLPLTCPSPLTISAAAAHNNPSPDPTPSYPPINVSFPFGTQPQCGASSSFLLSNDCQHQALRWPGFMDAINASADSDSNLAEPPFVLRIGNQSGSCFGDGFPFSVDISWNLSLAALRDDDNATTSYRHLICNPPSRDQIPQYFGSISKFNLNILQVIRGGADKSLVLDSDSTQLLLFNCTAPASQIDGSTWERNGSACQSYTQNQDCDSNDDTVKKFEATKCLRLRPCNNETHRNIDVGGWMNEMNCSHFQMNCSTSWSDSPKGGAALGTMRLRFNASHPLCPNCRRSGGECGYENVTSLQNFQCHCSDGRHDPVQCRSSSGPCGSQCRTALKACIPVATVCFCAIVIALLLLRLRRGNTKHNYLDPATLKEFTYKELSNATADFEYDNLIGRGGSGSVYLGVLETGRRVAIKRLYCDDFRRLDQFYNEMTILSHFQHPNLIKLCGFCSQHQNDLLLVFEYAPNGTVWDQLHRNQDEHGEYLESSFPWRLRLRIACETADALSYMHNSIDPPICHRDVKTTNILLDEHFHAKLADFGLSRLVPCGVTHVTTGPQGSPGYVDPDYQFSYQLTDKSDVYSFGVVLVELVSAKPAVDLSRKREEINLSSMAKAKMASGAWDELLDPSLQMHHNPDMESSVKAVLELALTCLHEEKEHRPTMQQVAKALADIYGAQDPSLY